MAEGQSGSFDPMLRKLIVILGAGASHGAREGQAPPLGKDLLDYLDRYLHLVEHELRKHDPYNESLSLLNRLLIAAISPPPLSYNPPVPRLDQAFAERSDLYDDFLYRLKLRGLDSRNLTFITLNYDLLLEQAMRRAGELYEYFPGGQTHEQGYTLLKIHGSINWWGEAGPFGPLEEGQPIPTPLTLTSAGLVYKDIRVEQDPYEASISFGSGDPILAHYGPGKPVYVNRPTISQVRSRVIIECEGAESALVIGVHPPVHTEEDETLWKMFASLRTRKVPTKYVSLPPDTETVEKVFQFQPIARTFREFVHAWSE